MTCPSSSFNVAGAGTGKNAVRRLHRAIAHDDRPAIHLVDAEQLQSPHGADHVENRIDRAHLVQMHFLRTDAVDLALGFRDRREGRIGALAYDVGYTRGRDHLADLLDVPPVRLRGNFEIDFRARDPGAQHALDAHLHAVEPEPRRERAQPLGIESDLEERSEHHVAGNAGERVDDRDW